MYTVTWKTVSETDGHLATGAYAFGVGESARNANAKASKSVVSPPPSILAVVARWLFFIGVMGIVGVASTRVSFALEELPASIGRILAGAWIVGTLGIAGLVAALLEAAGVGIGSLFSTSLGTTVIERFAATAATGLAVIAVSVGPTAAKHAAIMLAVRRCRDFDVGRRASA